MTYQKVILKLKFHHNCGWSCMVYYGHVNKMAVILCCGHIMWYSIQSFLHMTLFYPLVPYTYHCHSSMPCNGMSWYDKPASGDEPFCSLNSLWYSMSTKHTCISFHVFTSFGSSALSEQGITLSLLVTQEMLLLDLCVCHFSGNVINYLQISRIWIHSGQFFLMLHFS